MPLQQVEAEIANDEKVRLSFHAFGIGFRAGIARNGHDLRAVRLLDPVVGTAADIFAVDLHFDDRQFAPPGERGPLRIDAVDRNSNISRRQLGGNMSNQNEFVDQIDAINCDQETILPNLVGKMRHQPVDKLHILQRLQRQADGNLDLVIGRGELHRVGEHPRDQKLRQAMEERSLAPGTK